MLTLAGFIDLPAHADGGFDHGDVHRATGHVFVAHTANGTVEMIDGEAGRRLATIPDCPEASGVLCAQEEDLVFAAARADGRVLVIDAISGAVKTILSAGSRPNGLAWDSGRRRLLVADVGDQSVRIIDLATERVTMTISLPGRPRWCVFDPVSDAFFVNVKEPAVVAQIAASDGALLSLLPVTSDGPHGLDIDVREARLFVACDGGRAVTLAIESGQELASAPLPGVPDAAWFNPARERLYVAIGEPGGADGVDTAGGAVAEEIVTERGAQTTAFDHQRQRLYVFLPQSCRAAIYEER